VIELHSRSTYRVHFIGFLPGFPYLGGLDERLKTPRLQTPRTLVKAGSVGIAGSQTGIYPLDSPGGWRIIGWTPLLLFDHARNPPALLAPGKTLRFVPMQEEEFPHAASD
jgi:KipI family sensor histidine kinase inhibitor